MCFSGAISDVMHVNAWCKGVLNLDQQSPVMPVLSQDIGAVWLQSINVICLCVSPQAHSRADILHGGAAGSRQEVRAGDAALLRPVPVGLRRSGAQRTGPGTETRLTL